MRNGWGSPTNDSYIARNEPKQELINWAEVGDYRRVEEMSYWIKINWFWGDNLNERRALRALMKTSWLRNKLSSLKYCSFKRIWYNEQKSNVQVVARKRPSNWRSFYTTLNI